MSKQYHYVVFFDDTTNKWEIDWDVPINYDGGSIWDTETQEWLHNKDDWDEDFIIQELNTKLSKEA